MRKVIPPMMTKRFLLTVTILFAVCFYFGPQPEVKAIDPVTLAILAPIAIQGAKILAPYVMRAMGHFLKAIVNIGKHLLGFFRIPIGLFQCTLLAPFGGQFMYGLANLGAGSVEFLKFIGCVLILPLSFFGIGV